MRFALVLALLAWLPALARAEVLRPSETESLEAVAARAVEGDVVDIPPGIWPVHLVLERRITLRGAGGVLDGDGRGTVVTVRAPGVVLDGVSARNSGADLGGPDACVYAGEHATGVVVRGGHFEDCAFGIYVQRCDEARIEDNDVTGRAGVREADRGNGVHVFDSQHVVIRGNHVRGVRDGLFVAATNDSRIEDNRIDHVRYAIHYMWSHRNVLDGNVAEDSLTGLALMQSNDLVVEHNVILRNRRSGLLLRDTRDCRVSGNQLVGNGQALFMYNSDGDRIEHNVIVHNAVGAKIWGALVVNDEVHANTFVGNARQIFYVGSRDMIWGETPPGNHYSDYLGWDQDADGIGDRPYRVDSMGAVLVERYPAAALLLRSPALELLVHLEQRMPVLRVFTLVDRSPRMSPGPGVEEALELVGEGAARAAPGEPASAGPEP